MATRPPKSFIVELRDADVLLYISGSRELMRAKVALTVASGIGSSIMRKLRFASKYIRTRKCMSIADALPVMLLAVSDAKHSSLSH